MSFSDYTNTMPIHASNGGFLSHRATPRYHPFRTMGFSRSQKPSSELGVPP